MHDSISSATFPEREPFGCLWNQAGPEIRFWSIKADANDSSAWRPMRRSGFHFVCPIVNAENSAIETDDFARSCPQGERVEEKLRFDNRSQRQDLIAEAGAIFGFLQDQPD